MNLCPNGLAWCVFDTGIAIIALLFIADLLGIFDKEDK